MDTHEHHQLFNVGGAKVSRFEDIRLITGAGKYASDWNQPNQLHACFLRADRAHARIVSLNLDAAKRAKSVVSIYTGEDAQAAGYLRAPSFLPATGKGGKKPNVPQRPCLAIGKVCFVGDPVAMVVAESHLAAQDACELIEVVYEDLPAVVDPEEALKPGAPQLHDDVPGNCPMEAESGNEAATMQAIANAAHVVKLTVDCTRVTASPMEPRAALIEYKSETDSYVVHTPSQGVNMTRKQFGIYTQLPEEKFRVEIQDIGGGFGQRSTVYPEYVSMMIAAKALNRPIKWVSTRTESFLTDTHGRGNLITCTLALDNDARFTALRVDWITDQGAYLSPTGPAGHIRNATSCLNGVYKIPALYADFKVVLTNTGWVAAYRGAGRPDIAYAIERVVDAAAMELKMDPADLRRRNYVPLTEYPYKSATGNTIEIADLPGLSAKALNLADWSGFAVRKAASAKKGKLRGIGMSTVIEPTGAGQYPRDEIDISVDGASGDIIVHTVSQSQGQGHVTSFAMVVGNALGIPAERVKIIQGDPERAPKMVGNHSGGSRTMVGAGTVCHIAANKLIDAGKSLAAEDLGVEPSQVNYCKGEFSSPHSKKKITLAQLASSKKLAVTGEGTFTSTYPNGCHIAEVEVDPDTGVTDIVSYMSVDDCGHVVSHTIVEGQMHGAVLQGYGQVFGEHIVYDKDSGQMITGSFMDYVMPRAGQLPDIHMEEYTIYSKLGPLGIKGMGESGCTASLPALVAAVTNAIGVKHLDMPLTPSKVWKTLQANKA
ncbi:MAG: xanthine dehydrogenase family protein molybdopterin-binding subunit [Betaproteobacteria bacterium]|nr:xanthine dehydrogenase family protein molybdopterin-binding subunit [Betaproteobacteria bacterium]